MSVPKSIIKKILPNGVTAILFEKEPKEFFEMESPEQKKYLEKIGKWNYISLLFDFSPEQLKKLFSQYPELITSLDKIDDKDNRNDISTIFTFIYNSGMKQYLQETKMALYKIVFETKRFYLPPLTPQLRSKHADPFLNGLKNRDFFMDYNSHLYLDDACIKTLLFHLNLQKKTKVSDEEIVKELKDFPWLFHPGCDLDVSYITLFDKFFHTSFWEINETEQKKFLIEANSWRIVYKIFVSDKKENQLEVATKGKKFFRSNLDVIRSLPSVSELIGSSTKSTSSQFDFKGSFIAINKSLGVNIENLFRLFCNIYQTDLLDIIKDNLSLYTLIRICLTELDNFDVPDIISFIKNEDFFIDFYVTQGLSKKNIYRWDCVVDKLSKKYDPKSNIFTATPPLIMAFALYYDDFNGDWKSGLSIRPGNLLECEKHQEYLAKHFSLLCSRPQKIKSYYEYILKNFDTLKWFDLSNIPILDISEELFINAFETIPFYENIFLYKDFSSYVKNCDDKQKLMLLCGLEKFVTKHKSLISIKTVLYVVSNLAVSSNENIEKIIAILATLNMETIFIPIQGIIKSFDLAADLRALISSKANTESSGKNSQLEITANSPQMSVFVPKLVKSTAPPMNPVQFGWVVSQEMSTDKNTVSDLFTPGQSQQDRDLMDDMLYLLQITLLYMTVSDDSKFKDDQLFESLMPKFAIRENSEYLKIIKIYLDNLIVENLKNINNFNEKKQNSSELYPNLSEDENTNIATEFFKKFEEKTEKLNFSDNTKQLITEYFYKKLFLILITSGNPSLALMDCFFDPSSLAGFKDQKYKVRISVIAELDLDNEDIVITPENFQARWNAHLNLIRKGEVKLKTEIFAFKIFGDLVRQTNQIESALYFFENLDVVLKDWIIKNYGIFSHINALIEIRIKEDNIQGAYHLGEKYSHIPGVFGRKNIDKRYIQNLMITNNHEKTREYINSLMPKFPTITDIDVTLLDRGYELNELNEMVYEVLSELIKQNQNQKVKLIYEGLPVRMQEYCRLMCAYLFFADGEFDNAFNVAETIVRDPSPITSNFIKEEARIMIAKMLLSKQIKFGFDLKPADDDLWSAIHAFEYVLGTFTPEGESTRQAVICKLLKINDQEYVDLRIKQLENTALEVVLTKEQYIDLRQKHADKLSSPGLSIRGVMSKMSLETKLLFCDYYREKNLDLFRAASEFISPQVDQLIANRNELKNNNENLHDENENMRMEIESLKKQAEDLHQKLKKAEKEANNTKLYKKSSSENTIPADVHDDVNSKQQEKLKSERQFFTSENNTTEDSSLNTSLDSSLSCDDDNNNFKPAVSTSKKKTLEGRQKIQIPFWSVSEDLDNDAKDTPLSREKAELFSDNNKNSDTRQSSNFS